MKRLLPLALFALSTSFASGSEEVKKTVHDALYTEAPVVIDGKLDEAVWKKAQVYPLQVVWRKDAPQLPLHNGGKVRLAWDDQYLYLAAELEDGDVVAESDEDQQHHYRSGDVVELFLRPPGKKWYWELYGTPHSRKTAFFFPSGGRVFLPSSVDDQMDLKVASTIKGTLNQWKDKDEGWAMEMAVPLKDLTALGDAVAEGAPAWHILVARYNYSADHEIVGGELSTTSPTFSGSGFHNFEIWGGLRFVK